MRYDQVEKRCWRCGQGQFKLMSGSNYLWQCDHCKHVGQLKVSDARG